MFLTEDSYEVIILYLLEIDYYWQKFLLHITKNCNPNLMFQISEISLNKKNSYDIYLKVLASVKGSVSMLFIDNKFKVKLIHNKIFNCISSNPVNNPTEFYSIMIEVENRTIIFFQEYFGNLPYIKTKELLNRITKEKGQEIEKFRKFRA